MKRFALAAVGGIVIPFVYAIIVAPLSAYVTNPTIDQLLMNPVRWPVLLLFRFGVLLPFDNEIALLVYIVVCNVLVYSVLSYFLLWRFFKPKRRPGLLPPEPPAFQKRLIE